MMILRQEQECAANSNELGVRKTSKRSIDGLLISTGIYPIKDEQLTRFLSNAKEVVSTHTTHYTDVHIFNGVD